MSILTSRSIQLVIGVVIPIGFITISAVTRKVVRGSRFEWDDWYLGLELTLAAFSSTVTYLLAAPQTTPIQWDLAALLAVAFFVFVWQLAIHQGWQRGAHSKWRQRGMMAGLSNGLGVGLFYAFALIISRS